MSDVWTWLMHAYWIPPCLMAVSALFLLFALVVNVATFFAAKGKP